MKVTLKPQESISIQFEDTDGEFQIHFDTKEHRNQIVVKETAGLPGNIKGSGNERLYIEEFGTMVDKPNSMGQNLRKLVKRIEKENPKLLSIDPENTDYQAWGKNCQFLGLSIQETQTVLESYPNIKIDDKDEFWCGYASED